MADTPPVHVTARPFRFTRLAPADREAMTALVRSFGHDPGSIAVDGAVTRVTGEPWHLFLTEFLRNDDGRFYIDLATGDVAARTHLHEVDVEQLPAAIRPTDEP